MRSAASTPPGSRSSSTLTPRAAIARGERRGERRLARAVESLDRDEPSARHAAARHRTRAPSMACATRRAPTRRRAGSRAPTSGRSCPGSRASARPRGARTRARRRAPVARLPVPRPAGPASATIARAFAAELLADGASEPRPVARAGRARGPPGPHLGAAERRRGDARRRHRRAGRGGGHAHAVRGDAARVRHRGAPTR